MDDRSGGSPAEARQRWRIVFRRDLEPTPGARPESVDTWAAALSGSGLPIATSQGKTPRPRIALALPLPAGVAGEAELIDIVLTEPLTRADLRARLERHLPDGDRLIDVFDVWLGEPTLASQLAAADYRLDLRGTEPAAELAHACDLLLAAIDLPRSRSKGEGRVVEYDLRPLLLSLEIADRAAPAVRPAPTDGATIRMRLRLSLDAASGRPDEVVLTLGDALGRTLTTDRTVRERLLTHDDLVTIAARG